MPNNNLAMNNDMKLENLIFQSARKKTKESNDSQPEVTESKKGTEKSSSSKSKSKELKRTKSAESKSKSKSEKRAKRSKDKKPKSSSKSKKSAEVCYVKKIRHYYYCEW